MKQQCSMISALYILSILVFEVFYVDNAYFNIMEAKAMMLRIITAAFIVLFLVMILTFAFRENAAKSLKKKISQLDIVDYAVIIFAAVSDPESAELTGIDYVSGTSDALNTKQIIDMMLAADPDVKSVGLLYSKSETNSKKPVEEAKAYLDSLKIQYVEATGNTRDEVMAAASSLIGAGVDAVFTPTDNVIMDAELSIAESFAEAGIPHYAGADSFVRNGAFATCGVNYTELGKTTADLAYQAASEGMDNLDDYYLMDGGIVTVNTETADALGLDASVLSSFGELVEVTTTID